MYASTSASVEREYDRYAESKVCVCATIGNPFTPGKELLCARMIQLALTPVLLHSYAAGYDELDGGDVAGALGFDELREQMLKKVSACRCMVCLQMYGVPISAMLPLLHN